MNPFNTIFQDYFSENKVNELSKLDENEIDSLKIFFSDEASNYYKFTYLVGEEQIKIYGNPLVMKVYCKFFNSLYDTKDAKNTYDNIQILPNFKVSKFPIQFMILWGYVNGITETVYFMSNNTSFEEIFNLIEITNWLGFDLFLDGDTIQDKINELMFGWTHITAKNIYWIQRILDLSYKLYITGYSRDAQKLKENVSIVLSSGIEFSREKEDEKEKSI
jgi:hypothetical protein